MQKTVFRFKMVFTVLYMGTIVPNKEKTDAFNTIKLHDCSKHFT